MKHAAFLILQTQYYWLAAVLPEPTYGTGRPPTPNNCITTTIDESTQLCIPTPSASEKPTKPQKLQTNFQEKLGLTPAPQSRLLVAALRAATSSGRCSRSTRLMAHILVFGRRGLLE